MSGRVLTETEASRIHAEPVNWEPAIKENTWWSAKSGTRQFVIIRVGYDFPDAGCKGAPVPVRVEFLEFKKTDPIVVTWTQFVKLASEGEMVRLTE